MNSTANYSSWTVIAKKNVLIYPSLLVIATTKSFFLDLVATISLLLVYMTSSMPCYMFVTSLRLLLFLCRCWWPLDAPINFVEVINPLYYYLLSNLNIHLNIFVTTTTFLPTCSYLFVSTWLLTIGYYVFRRHQVHFWFHDFKIVSCYYVKLNASYLPWAQSFRLFVGLLKKLKHLTEDLPTKGTTT